MENVNENLEIVVTKTADIINIILHEIALVINTRVNGKTYKLFLFKFLYGTFILGK